MEELEFREVTFKNCDIDMLYELLKNRGDHSISHKKMPSLKDHRDFVKNHPYRKWYIVLKNGSAYGTFYILKDNCVGLFLRKWYSSEVKIVLDWIKKNHQPLSAIPSVRRDTFFINVSPQNSALINILNELKSNKIQLTFAL